MRTFIAIETPLEVQKQIQDTQKQINFTPEQAKITTPKDPHITLKFLGDIPETTLPQIKQALKNIHFKKFKAQIKHNASFPNENYMRVAWLTIEPQQQITQLQQEIEKQLTFIKIKKQEKFIPHITLARFKYVKDRKTVLEKIKTLKINTEWEVSSFNLIKSTLTPKGSVYEILEEYQLKNQLK